MEYRRSLEMATPVLQEAANEKNTYCNIRILISTRNRRSIFIIRFSVLQSRDFKPDTTKSKSILDLRPQLIAKLQQLVKDGSNGLYNLSIGKIEPHISSGGVDMNNGEDCSRQCNIIKIKKIFNCSRMKFLKFP